jgi:hypothetical protein
LIRVILEHLRLHPRPYLASLILLLFLAGLWPFNFTERNNASFNQEGGLLLARHGTGYTASSAGKLQDLKPFAIRIDLATSSDGQDSLAKIFGSFISQADQNFFLAQWKDGLELRVRTERNAAGMIFGADGVLGKGKRTVCLIIYDGQKMHLYENGQLVRKDNRGPLSFSNWSREYPLVVGSDANGRLQWKGTLFEVAIYDRTLTQNEVLHLSGHAAEKWELGTGNWLLGKKDRSGQIRENAKGKIAAGLKPPVMTETGDGGILRQAQDDRPLIHDVSRPESTEAVASGQWLVASEQTMEAAGEKKEDKRPLIHYIFKPENTYETEFRGKRATGVRDLGKGAPADLVIPESFEPYARVFLGWDPDWAKSKTNWLDVAINIVGFVPLGVLLMLSLGKKAASGNEGYRPQATDDKDAEERQEKKGIRLLNRYKTAIVVVLAVAVGFVVSFAIEWLQAYLPSRDSSLRDLVTNTLGTLMGALAAVWYLRNRIA